MKEYKLIICQEGMLGSFFFGVSKLSPVKSTDFINKNTKEGWRAVTMEKNVHRMLLFFAREAYLVILEKEI